MILILLGSKADSEFADKISKKLNELGVPHETKVASAHKAPAYLLQLMNDAEAKSADLVYITVAGKSNGLSGVVAGNTTKPVIACPPFESDAAYLADIHSTLRMPSDVCPMAVLKPENAALAAAKIAAMTDKKVHAKVAEYMKKVRTDATGKQ